MSSNLGMTEVGSYRTSVAGAAPATLPAVAGRNDGGAALRPVQPAPAATDVLQQAAQRVVDALQNGGNRFDFSFDKQTGLTVVKVFNRATGELVRQIPSEEIVHLAQLLQQDEQQPVLDVRV